MNRYYSRHWKEGEENGIRYYFETNDEGFPIRQLEIWDNGKKIRYDLNNRVGDEGFLADQALERNEFKDYEISKEDFEKQWQIK